MTDAKEKVHVISGDLKASGRVDKTEHEVHSAALPRITPQ